MNMLLVAVLLLQDKTAEDAFKKAEESLEKAKTLQVVIAQAERRLTLKLKEGNKLFLQVEKGSGFMREARVLSDGNQMSLRTLPFKEKRRKTPETLEAAVKTVLFRGGFDGVESLIEGLLFKADEGNKGFDFKTMFGISELVRTDPGDSTQNFHFTLKKRVTWRDPDSSESGWVGVRLCVQSDDSQIRGRAVSSMGKVVVNYSETYKEFILNADIPDETFKLAEEKK